MSRVAASIDGPVLHLVVGDGERRNALGEDDWASLGRLVGDVGTGATGIRAVVVSGHGGSFSAGSDMREWVDAQRTDVERAFTTMEGCFRAIEDCPLPVVAAVEGVAAGAGCQLALACDLVVMAESARIGMPIARLGILASPAFAARVSSRVGPALAADLYLTGRLLAADEARAAGLVSRVVPDGSTTRRALDLAASIAARPPEAVAAAKAAIHLVAQPERHVVPATGSPTPTLPSVATDAFHDAVRRFLEPPARPA